MAFLPLGVFGQYTTTDLCVSNTTSLGIEDDGSNYQSLSHTFEMTSSDFLSGFTINVNTVTATGNAKLLIYNDTDPTDGLSNELSSTTFSVSTTGEQTIYFGDPSVLTSGSTYTLEIQPVSTSFSGAKFSIGATGSCYANGVGYFKTSSGGTYASTIDFYLKLISHEDGTYSRKNGNWATASGWFGPTNNVVPPAGVDIEIEGNVTYDETNEYTSSPKRYNDILFKQGKSVGLSITGGDLVFTGDLDGPGTGNGLKASVTLTSGNSLVAYGSTNVNIADGDFEIENGSLIILTENFDLSLSSGNSITIKDNGRFLIYENNANFNINGPITIEKGGIFYVVDRNSAALTFNIENTSFTVKKGGVFGDLGGGNATIDLNQSGNTGQVIFEPGATYYEGNISSSYSFTDGDPVYQYEFENTSSGNWHHIAFPFSGLTWATTGISGDPINPNFTSGQYNVFTWDASQNGATGISNGWSEITSSSSTIKSALTTDGEAYAVYTGGSNFPVSNSKASITPDGSSVTLHSVEDHTYNLDFFYDAAGRSDDKDRGWNFIPNPFVAYLNIGRLVTDSEFGPTYDAIHYWDASQGKYVAYVNAGGTIIESTAQSGNIPTTITGTYEDYISPFRGFWVKASSTSQSIKIKPSMRVITGIQGNSNSLHHALKGTTTTPEIMRLMTQNSQGHVYEVVWNHIPGEDSEFGSGDAYARAPDNPYSPMIGDITSGDTWAIINSLDMTAFGTRTVGFSAAGNQLFTWKLDTVSVPGVNNIFLLDKKTGVITDLLVSDYNFANDPNYGADRFEVSISGNVSLTENPLEATEVTVLDNHLMFAIQNQSSVQLEGSIFDIQGREVFAFSQEVDHGSSIELPSLATGIYIVNWSDDQGHAKSQKVFIP